MSGRALIPRFVCALLFLSLAATTLPRLFALAGGARALLHLPYEARRERQMGQWFVSIEALRLALPPGEPVALIAAPRDFDSAVFANYYLYPIRTGLFFGRDGYRDATPDPTRPNTIVAVTAERVERTAYDVLRDRDLRAGRRVVATPQLSDPATAFVLPIAASLDGPAPETFVIEATLANPNPEPAVVRVTFWPKGAFRTLTIAPGATASYYDFVHQLFGVMESGWMRVDSAQPLRAAFYFANRGRADATRLPNVQRPATRIAAGALRRDTKLFLLNPADSPALATVGREAIPLLPHAIVSKPIISLPLVGGNVYAFVTTRELNGKTDFLWPAQ
ncbi:MAG: hypothetical protein M3P29_12820 [Acidobacteriota bacterium]|nr:hypothetical protein [Acidobacteriota bacterium]